MFIDEVVITLRSGSGGAGCMSFLRDKYRPRGGPNGGNGGRGGDIVLVAKPNIKTLIDFYHHRIFKAATGGAGEGSDKHGRGAEDLTLSVPLGTTIEDLDGEVLADLVVAGDSFVAARGGRGGRGNAAFRNDKIPVPKFAERGEPGEECSVHLKFKVIADVGLIGFPNVGKSTLISKVSRAHPKIANYPFTTLTPNLGVVNYDEEQLVFADIPGLIEGAHEGQGLGIAFLKHIERTTVLLHIVDLTEFERPDCINDYEVIMGELKAFDEAVAKRPMIVVGNKIDAVSSRERTDAVSKHFKDAGLAYVEISAVAGTGVDLLKELVWELYRSATETERLMVAQSPQVASRRVYSLDPDQGYRIQRSGHKWIVIGASIEKFVSMMDLENEYAAQYVAERLRRMGVETALRKAGALEGDPVEIAGQVFELSTGSEM